MQKDFDSQFAYLKFSQICLGLLAFFYILYIGHDLLVPLVLATLIAILLNPVVKFLHRRMNRVLAIIIVLVLAAIVIAAIVYFVATQLMHFTEAAPQFKQRFLELWNQLLTWTGDTFNLSRGDVNESVQKMQTDTMDKLTEGLGRTLGSIGGTLSMVVLLPIYVFMILLYKPMIIVFIEKLFKPEQKPVVDEVLHQTQSIIQSYLIGLLLEIALVTALNATGLLIIGVEYAVLLAFIGALLNLIPYLGAIVAMVLMTVITFATKSPAAALWVALLYLFVQFIDNNFILPKVVGSKVKINAFVSILAVLVGGAIWGIAGMFLAIPLVALTKIVFDRVEPLEPFGYILGDDMPETNAPNLSIKERLRRLKKLRAKKK
jgi:predicted PurR-regulated permease PerM